MSPGVILFACSFSRTGIFGLSQVAELSGLHFSTRHGFYLIQWSLSQARYWLSLLTCFVPPLHQPIFLPAGHHFRSSAWQLGGCFLILKQSAEYLPVPKTHQNVGMIATYVSTSSFSLCEMDCLGTLFSNEALPSLCGDQPIAATWVVWSLPEDPLPNNFN